MQRRALFSLINIAVAVGAIVVLFAFPRYAGYAIYGFLGWFVVSLSMIGFARGAPAGAGPSSGGAPSGAGSSAAPLPPAGRPAVGGAAAPPAIPFCIYCATDLPTEAARCPGCGRAVRQFA